MEGKEQIKLKRKKNTYYFLESVQENARIVMREVGIKPSRQIEDALKEYHKQFECLKK